MFAYAVRRLAAAIPIVLVSTFVTFILVALSGNPLGPLLHRNPRPPQHVIDLEKHRLHLDDPMLQRYWIWLKGLAHGDFGPSVHENVNIGSELVGRWFTTMRLIGLAMLLALVFALIAGLISAQKQYSKTDYSLTFVGFLFLSMPSFWIAILLKQGGISFNNQLFSGNTVIYTINDSSVYIPGGAWDYILNILGHMVLPTISLALINYAAWSRYVRGSMLEVMNSDYVRLARAKGIPRRRVMVNHALRTALIPVTTVVALDFGAILSGAVITETVFQWDGMGKFLLDSIKAEDVYAVSGWLLISAVTIVVANLVADLLYAVLDPRIRYA